MRPEEMHIGCTFKMPRSKKEYTCVGIFEDQGQTFYVGRYTKEENKNYTIYSYQNIFWFDEDGQLNLHV